MAIKVLSPRLSQDPDLLGRFEREAQAVAALSHPNVLSIFDFGKEGDVVFLVMELLDGETVRARLERGAVPVRKAIDYARQVAQGLAAAHLKGIVHRDLKPENLFVTKEGRIKILDFGLAKLTSAVDARYGDMDQVTVAGHTTPGMVVGTMGYMSPEQVRGQKADHRCDIFTLGVVLYELLLGERAFSAGSAADTMSAILKEDPKNLSRAERELPPVLTRIMQRCLEKNPDERFQSVRDLGFALEAISDLGSQAASVGASAAGPATAEPAEPRPSIAVLPFTNMSSDKEQDYFCEGMAEEIMNALNHIEGLHVASRMSAFQFKEQALDVRGIGKALNVKTVLEGSVRTARTRLRVMAQLTNIEDGYQLWSDKYDREMEDVFAIQDEISAKIVEALRVKLVGRQTVGQANRRTTNLEAYHLFLKGRYNWYKRELDSLQKAVEFFEKAVDKDPSYALAHAGLAESYCSLGLYGLRPNIASARATAAVERALALDDSLAEAHAALAMKRYYLDWDWDDAEREFKRALELNASYVLASCWYAYMLSAQGRHDESIAVARRAQELDPLSPFVNTVIGIVLLGGSQNDEAITELEKALEMEGDFLLALWILSGAYCRYSRHDEAVALIERAATLAERGSFVLGLLGWVYASTGRHADAEELLRELSARAEQDYVAPPYLAWILGALGRMDEAFAYLDQAYEERHPFLVFHMIPVYDHLRSDSRYHQLLRRMRLQA